MILTPLKWSQLSTVTDNASNFRKAFSDSMSIEMESNGGELSDDDESGGEQQAMNIHAPIMHVSLTAINRHQLSINNL